jgi:hypothetical protein
MNQVLIHGISVWTQRSLGPIMLLQGEMVLSALESTKTSTSF